jgi:outer membrane protein TolC
MKYGPIITAAVGLIALAIAGCTHPLDRSLEQQLREQLAGSRRAHLDALTPGQVITTTRRPSEVEAELTDQRRRQLDAMSGPNAYGDMKLDIGGDLVGNHDEPMVAITLQRAIREAVANNLTIQIARIQPAVTETQLRQAEAIFDASFFANVSWEKLDTPRPEVSDAFSALGLGSSQSDSTSFTTGIRKPLTTGGQATVQTTLTNQWAMPSSFTADDSGFRYYSNSITMSVSQPLLRNFGTEVNRAQIEITENARREAVHDLHGRLLDLVQVVEEAYWNLVFQRQRLLIQQHLLTRTIDTRDRVKQRENYDATPAQITEANSFVESRRAELIRARQAVRRASDELKRLINTEDLHVADEMLLMPLESPADLAFEFSLLDSVTTALNHRPEVKRALLEISDASIRQRVADNQRLPLLNIIGTVRYNGVGDSAGDTYSATGDAQFIDYLFGAEFEMPIGNREAQAAYRQRQLERRASVINYQRVAQDVVVEVKDSMREVTMDYELIGAERAARRAAAENVRALQEQEEAGEALTPEFSDRKLRRLEALASAELRELQSLVDYQIAISNYYRTMGTLLEHNAIDFNDPLADAKK